VEQIKQRSLCKTFFGVSSIKKLRSNAEFENAGKTMLITISCALIGHIRNNISDLIGAKTAKGRESCSSVSSRLWGGALRDEPKNGCEGDYSTASLLKSAVVE